MNSSAITNSIMPTVSVPGATASESKGSGFGDLMASITDNWSERNSQVKYDAAKSAQSKWDNNRADLDEKHNPADHDDADYSASNDYRDDEPHRAERSDRDDHAQIEDHASDESRDMDAGHRDEEVSDRDTQHADNADTSENDGAEAHANDDDGNGSGSEQSQSAAAEEQSVDENVVASNPNGAADPNQPAQTVPLPGSQAAIDLAKAKAAANQPIAGANAAQNAANANGAAGQAAQASTNGLLNSTALSQPVAASSAKMALNGAEAAATDDVTSDQFLSRVMDTMTGDGKAKADATGISNATANSQSTNGNAPQAATANPAQTAQAAQQAMAAAAGAQNMQNNPNAAQATAANGSVTATGGTEATAQVANGQPGSTNSLHQTNTGGQTAQTARQAPGQQVQQQVAVSIKNAASDGVDKISVQLRPEHLGRVDVKMEIGHDGRIQGVIQADTRETLDMLRQDSRALQQALKDAGLNADSQSFTFEHRDQGGQSQEGKGQSRMTADQGSSPDDGDILSGAELAEHVGIGYGINPNGLVDIRI
ncbi:MAG: flagellar hook-length control protein FliK [Thalassospira sp.]|uniref:flagellar hook-length control protein FliK n=1 Tax=Thalassospira sp. TaxID=1912094 RepID=UPI003A8C5651